MKWGKEKKIFNLVDFRFNKSNVPARGSSQINFPRTSNEKKKINYYVSVRREISLGDGKSPFIKRVGPVDLRKEKVENSRQTLSSSKLLHWG